MAQIYAGSLCTLATLASENSNGGFCRSTDKMTNFPYRFNLSLGSQRIRVFPCEPNDWGSEMHGPLLDRAWTLQERELSTRILHCSRNALLWECKTSRASADLPWLRVSNPRRALFHVPCIPDGVKEARP